jgi:dienelactone hydrolase
MEDAQAILHWGSAQTSLPASRMLLVGRSLGSGVAVQLAAQQPVAGLVLLSPPASIRALAIRNPLLLPAVPWLRSPFDSLAHAHQVRSPSLVLLAERDRRVPHSESLKLVAALRERTRGTSRSCEVLTVPRTTHRSLARDATTLAAIAAFSRAMRPPGTSLDR